MAKDILRQDVKDVIAAYKGGAFGARSVASRTPPVGVKIKNATFSSVPSGAPLQITGFSQDFEYDVALRKYLNDELYLTGFAPDESAKPEEIATTLEPIGSQKFGRASAEIVGAKVVFPADGDDYEYASATFVAAESGPFRIVAKSKLSAERVAVCALAKVAATPAPGSAIRAARVATAWTQNETRTEPLEIAYYDAELGREVSATALSPLSRYRDALPVDAQILVAQIADGSWILLNAECPE